MRLVFFMGILFPAIIQSKPHTFLVDNGHSKLLIIRPATNLSADSEVKVSPKDHVRVELTMEEYWNSNSSEKPWPLEVAATREGASHFTHNFDYPLKNQTKNYVSSPLSAWMTLTMFYAGSKSSTQNRIRQILGIPNGYGVRLIGIGYLYDSFYWSHSDIFFYNVMYAAQGTHINKDFVYELNLKGNTVRSLNFLKTQRARSDINRRVKNESEKHIRNIVSRTDLKPNTSMIALSAAFFNGSFDRAFNPATEREFYVSKFEVKKVPMMNVRSSFRYGRTPHADASFVEIPYQREDDHNVSMIVILPDVIDGIDELRKKEFNVSELLAHGSMENVHIHLPKFEISTKINLEHRFRPMGLAELFESPNLSRISKSHVVIDKIIQKVFVRVDEHGAKSPNDEDNEIWNDYIPFKANRPFLAIITSVDENPLILFKMYYHAAEHLGLL